MKFSAKYMQENLHYLNNERYLLSVSTNGHLILLPSIITQMPLGCTLLNFFPKNLK